MQKETEASKALQEKIDALKNKVTPSRRKGWETQGVGLLIMILSDLLGGLLVGAALGYLFQTLFHLHHSVIGVFVLLGGLAGLLNVFKTGVKAEKEKRK